MEEFILHIIRGKRGLEIGGPTSFLESILHANVSSIDNAVFKINNIWSSPNPTIYRNVYETDSTNLHCITDSTYDFVLASHVFEHIANPLKALLEYKRVLKNDGYIILITPIKDACFDHDRDFTLFETLLEKYTKDVGEDDLSSLREILAKHDLNLDKPAGTFVQFVQRSLNNFENRCLHHHVFNAELIQECAHFTELHVCKLLNADGFNFWSILKK